MTIIHASSGVIATNNRLLTLSGHNISNTQSSPTDAYARLKVDQDGQVYESLDTGSESWSLIDSATDWIRPLLEAPGDVEVRFTNLVNDALFSSTVVEDTWHPMSSSDFILVQREVGLGVSESTFDVEARYGSSGGAKVSAEYTLFCDTS